MIAYVSIGTNDLEKSAAFYDAVLGELGAAQFMKMDRAIFWGTAPGKPMVSVFTPFDGEPATVGNGSMVALAATSKEAVDRAHAKAIALGAKNEGDPGPRGPEGQYYIGYFRDLDGNKLNAVYLGG